MAAIAMFIYTVSVNQIDLARFVSLKSKYNIMKNRITKVLCSNVRNDLHLQSKEKHFEGHFET